MPLNPSQRNLQLLRRLPEKSDLPCAVAIGNFDGLHLGHQAVIKTMRDSARAKNLLPAVLTFEPHPKRFFAPESAAFRLATLRDKLVHLRETGVARIVMPRFDAAFAAMPARQFLDDVLGHRLNAKVVVTGENFAFGHKRMGNSAMLKAWGAQRGVEIITVPPVTVNGTICSSSAVRQAIAAGDMQTGRELLGRFYSLRGRVVHGEGRGQKIGFPTANIALPPNLLLPAYGVYAVHVRMDGIFHNGAANLGTRPTIASYTQPTLEVHVFDMRQQIYGKTLETFFVSRLRPEMKFSGVQELTAQIAKDCETARALLREQA